MNEPDAPVVLHLTVPESVLTGPYVASAAYALRAVREEYHRRGLSPRAGDVIEWTVTR